MRVCIVKGCWRPSHPVSERNYANGRFAMYCEKHYRPQPGDNASTHTRIKMTYE